MNLPKPDFESIFTDATHKQRSDTSIPSEDVALSEALTYKAPQLIIRRDGTEYYTLPRYWGFDVWSASYEKLISYFSDARITNRSNALISLVLRKTAVRFPTEYARDKTKLFDMIKKFNPLFDLNEIELIESNATNDPAFFGGASIQNLQLFNGKLTNPRSKFIKLKNEEFKIVRG